MVCRSEETARRTLRDIQSTADGVHGVRAKLQTKQWKPAEKKAHGQEMKAMTKPTCKYCGQTHAQGRKACPAYGQECRTRKCKKKNHFAKVCRSSHAHAHEIISDTDSAASIEHIDVTSEVSMVQGKRKIFASMLVIGSGKTVNFHVDTGSSVNIIPASVLSADAEITPTTTILKSWSGNLIKPVGECRVLIRNHRTGKKYRVRFQVVKEGLTPIIGLTASQSMQLITIHKLNIEQPADRVHSVSTQSAEDIIAAYPDVFGDGIGTLPGEQHLRTDPSVSPHINPMRRVPHSVVEPLKEELKAMEAKGVIKRVQEPTAWESSLVVTRKSNGNLRVCIDPKHLNVALARGTR